MAILVIHWQYILLLPFTHLHLSLFQQGKFPRMTKNSTPISESTQTKIISAFTNIQISEKCWTDGTLNGNPDKRAPPSTWSRRTKLPYPLRTWMRSVLYFSGVNSQRRTWSASRTLPSSRYSRYFCCSSKNFILWHDRKQQSGEKSWWKVQKMFVPKQNSRNHSTMPFDNNFYKALIWLKYFNRVTVY